MLQPARAATCICATGLWLVGLGGSASSRAQAPSQLPVSDQCYELAVELDVTQHVVSGTERIHFTNHAKQALHELYFHLYPNAFRDRNSVFMREQGDRLRNGTLQHPGRLTVTQLSDAAGHDLLSGAAHELISGDATQLRVVLPAALQPMAAIDLALTFRTELPEIVARSGYAGDFHMLGQWFPKLARLEPDGSFATFPYHGLGEFYADFADYRVEISVPDRYQIAAAGVRVASAVEDSTRHERYAAQHVHDFAWAAYPYFTSRVVRVGAVELQLFAPRGYDEAVEQQLRVLRAALPYFEQRYGAYPYPRLTVIIPPSNAQRAAGMEYPTLFVSAGPAWALPPWLPNPQHDVVAVHELAHQWFSGMIASDEVSYPALDEGLAEWASLDFLRHFYRAPPQWLARWNPPLALFDIVRALFLWRPGPVPSSLLPITSYRYETLSRAIYMRPGLVLEAIAERFGRHKLQAALANYARNQRFGHPTPRELFAAFDATFEPGFAARVLAPALAGEQPAALRRESDRPTNALGGATFGAELLLLAQAALSWLGA